MSTLTHETTLTVLVCSSAGCGVTYALDDDFIAARRGDRQTFYCPNGHSRWYPGRTVEQERAELEKQLAAARRTQQHLRADVEHEQARVRGYQGALAKAQKRAAKGVCPAPGCKRSFADLAAHVATCHPDMA